MTEPTLEVRLDRVAEHLDELAARVTRAVADLRAKSQTVLDDIAAWKQHADFGRVDAELARMDARDTLRNAEDAFERRVGAIVQRIDDARDDTIATFLRLQDGIQTAVGEVARSAGLTIGDNL